MIDSVQNEVLHDVTVHAKDGILKTTAKSGWIFFILTLLLLIYFLIENRQLKFKALINNESLSTKFSVNMNPQVTSPTIQTKADILIPKNSNTHTQVNTCSSEECLFINEDTPEGYAKIEGYYHEYNFDDWGTPVICKGFIVTSGSETLIANFNKNIDNGNMINKRIDGKLIVNLDLSELDSKIVNLITSSNMNNQIRLGVLRISPQGRGVSTCSSVLGILTAKPVNK